MKKCILFFAALCMAGAANSKIIRVSNVTGSSAPYANLEEGLAAAAEGDTIMIDASKTIYDGVTINRRVVLVGAGYDLVKNGIMSEGASATAVGSTVICAEGTVVKGISFMSEPSGSSASVAIKAPKVIVNRCKLSLTLKNEDGINAPNCVISQCFLYNFSGGSNSFVQMTNNIIKGRIAGLNQSYIAYNTCYNNGIFMVNNSTCEYNIVSRSWGKTGVDGNSIDDEYETDIYYSGFNASWNDKQLSEVDLDPETRNTYGAFAGAHPYVISGVPSGPVIQDMKLPTTVEQGSMLNVTLKIGMQQ